MCAVPPSAPTHPPAPALPGVSVPATDGGALPAGPAALRAAVECQQPVDGPGAC